MRALLVGIVVLCCASVAPAQESRTAGIHFGEMHADVVILLDGEQISPAGGDTIQVVPGVHVIEQVIGNRFRWTIHRIVDTLELVGGQTATVRPLAEAEHLITSHPVGADIYRNGTRLGTTPYVYRDANSSEGTISLRMAGFEQKVITPSRSFEHVFLLRSEDIPPGSPESMRGLEPPINNRTWTISSAVVMIGSSLAAAYLKEKANTALEEYQRTNSQAALDDVRRYDMYSGIAAATMVVSFTGFALFLTTE